MLVEVFKLDNAENGNAITTFPTGNHIIGRSEAFQCNDKRVSRNHAILDVGQDSVKITSNHVNPVFTKLADSKTITIIPKDSTVQLNSGDAFAFLPDMFWFKIKLIQEEPSNATSEEDKQGVKRQLDNGEGDMEEKRLKTGENGFHESDNIENGSGYMTLNGVEESNNVASTSKQGTSDDINGVKHEPKEEQENESLINTSDSIKEQATSDTKIEPEDKENEGSANSTTDNPASDNQTTSQDETKKEEKTDESNSDKASRDTDAGTSTSKPRRERCWYGAQCYRKNPAHRDDFTHPGDSDYESDPNDNRPTCSYGAACYRKNKDHRRDYKHPAGPPPTQQKKKRTRKKVDHLNAVTYSDSDLSDISDEDPFIVDDEDSDDYVQESDSGDSDWEDSQGVDEDSENVKRLVKEAKRFTKK